MKLDDDYVDFLIRSVQWITDREGSTGEMLLKVNEEAGEAAEAWLQVLHLKEGRKCPADVAHELGDLIHAAMVAIVHLGFDPADMLDANRDKVEAKYLAST